MSEPLRFMPPEEQARANFYALLARLFYAPPDEGFLKTLAAADELDAEDEALAARWRELIAAAPLGRSLCESAAWRSPQTLAVR